MSWCRSVCAQFVWGPLCFLYLYTCFLLYIWKLFSHNFFKYILNPLSLFFLESLLCIDWHALYYPIDGSYCFLFFFFIWFSLCSPDLVISILLSSKSLICSSALFFLLVNAFNSAFVSLQRIQDNSYFFLWCIRVHDMSIEPYRTVNKSKSYLFPSCSKNGL